MGDEKDAMLESGKRTRNRQGLAKFLAGCIMLLGSSWGGICLLLYVEIKALFDLTQTEVEILAGIHTMMMFFVLPYSLIHTKYGFYPTFLCGIFTTGLGYFMMVLAAKMPNTFLGHPLLLYVYMALWSSGRACIMFVLLLTTMSSVPKAHSGKAVSATIAMVYVGFVSLAPIYKAYFADVRKISMFFCCCLVVLAGTSAVYLFVYVISGATPTTEDTGMGEGDGQRHRYLFRIKQNTNKSDDEGTVTLNSECSSKDCTENQTPTVRMMLLSEIFQLYLWSGAIILSCTTVYFTNLSLLLCSLGLGGYQNHVVITAMLIILFSHLACGTVYDSLEITSSKVMLMIGVAVCNVLSFVVILISMDNLFAVFVSVIFMSLTNGWLISTYFNFSANIFGLHYAGIVQGILMTLFEVFCLINTLITGILYDYFVQIQGSVDGHVCYGVNCFWWAWLIMLCLSLPAVLLTSLLMWRLKKTEMKTKR